MAECDRVAAVWDAEYTAGRYLDEMPVPFIRDILGAARAHGACSGLYVGCGNGRNFLPLVEGGLELTGVDISATAIRQLAERAPGCRRRLVHGDVAALPPGAVYALVIGIQVFQHGDRATAWANIRAARERTAPGGLFALRVNAVGTDVWPAHEITGEDRDGGFTVRYLAGPKRGLHIHFFSAAELGTLFGSGFEPVIPLRLRSTRRTPAAPGQWSQWEAIWRKTARRVSP